VPSLRPSLLVDVPAAAGESKTNRRRDSFVSFMAFYHLDNDIDEDDDDEFDDDDFDDDESDEDEDDDEEDEPETWQVSSVARFL
jgi:hypothetical protein